MSRSRHAAPRLTCAAVLAAASFAVSACKGGSETSGNNAAPTAGLPPVQSAPTLPSRWSFGHAATTAQIAAWNTDVNPAGVGLPAGSGTAAQGAGIYAAKCALCHGAAGEGIPPYPKLIQPATANDSFPFDRDPKIPKTIGNYWPYATTVYEYISRAMPLDKPGSLTPAEVYSLTAYLLAKNKVIPENAVMNAATLPKVKMPSHNHFVRDNRAGGGTFR